MAEYILCNIQVYIIIVGIVNEIIKTIETIIPIQLINLNYYCNTE